MSRKENTPGQDMPQEVRDRLDALITEYKTLRRKGERLKTRVIARTAVLRQALNEFFERLREREARLNCRLDAICAEFMALWAKHLPTVRQVVLSSAKVSKRRNMEITVLDKEAVIDALDRLDRLDLVDQVVDEKGLKQLVKAGKLDDLPETALKVKVRITLQAYARKEE